jgi:hypothetical protein
MSVFDGGGDDEDAGAIGESLDASADAASAP